MPLKELLPQNIFDTIERCGLSTIRQIILLSIWDIKKYTNLSIDDIVLLKNIVSQYVCTSSVTCDHIMKNRELVRIPTGCDIIDGMLKGGFQKGSVTEIFGESGSGKTQLALQTSLHNSDHGCVYICTEDVFPTKRFEEIKGFLPKKYLNIDVGKNVFVQHISEAKDLLSCIRVHLSNLLSLKSISLIVIDSIAAPFRCENMNYVKRAEELREIGMLLTAVAQNHNIAIVCINQVTANFAETVNMLPSLGLAWSNMVTTRLMIRKTSKVTNIKLSESNNKIQNIYLREMSVVFAPDLPNDMIQVVITSRGIHGVKDK